MTILIKDAVYEDVYEITKIQSECRLSLWSVDDYHKEIKSENSLVLVAKFGDRIAGFLAARASETTKPVDVAFNLKRGELDILNFGVFEKFQRQGIGNLLIDELLDRAFQTHLKSVWLEVRQSNSNAMNFYRKRGFEEVQIRKNFYTQPFENAVVMKLDLKVPNKT